MTTNTKNLAVVLGLALMAAYPMEASANQYTVSDGEREHYEETLKNLGYKDGVGHSDADIAKIAKDIIRANPSKLTDDPKGISSRFAGRRTDIPFSLDMGESTSARKAKCSMRHTVEVIPRYFRNQTITPNSICTMPR